MTKNKIDNVETVSRIIKNSEDPAFMDRNGDLLVVRKIIRYNESGMSHQKITELVFGGSENEQLLLLKDFHRHAIEASIRKIGGIETFLRVRDLCR